MKKIIRARIVGNALSVAFPSREPIVSMISILVAAISAAAALVPQSAAAAGSDADVCARLAASECIKANECVLVRNEPPGQGYSCREGVNECERSFAQVAIDEQTGHLMPQDDLARACVERSGCEFLPAGECFCPPIDGLSCLCSGGTPPACRPEA